MATRRARDEVQAFFATCAPDARPDAPTPPTTPITNLDCTLHTYQRQAVAWAVHREEHGPDAHGVRGGVLAEEMGLGKTIEIFGLIVEHAACPVPPATMPFTHPAHGGELVCGAA